MLLSKKLLILARPSLGNAYLIFYYTRFETEIKHVCKILDQRNFPDTAKVAVSAAIIVIWAGIMELGLQFGSDLRIERVNYLTKAGSKCMI